MFSILRLYNVYFISLSGQKIDSIVIILSIWIDRLEQTV